MASKTAVGSSLWIAAEQENVQELLQQEKEDFIYPAQHEMEWLNEHMSDIFNKSHIDVANVFKTPGKLRGKTPRTIRKRNAEQRIVNLHSCHNQRHANSHQPLSDVFSSEKPLRSSPRKSDKGAIRFTVAQDVESVPMGHPTKSQTDSGYHGSSQADTEPVELPPQLPPRSPFRTAPILVNESQHTEGDARTTEGSFHSAKEDQTAKIAVQLQEDHAADLPTKDIVMQDADADADAPIPDLDDIGSPSDESTPEIPVMRKKSSMTFASLPARDPVKTSIGARISRTSHVTSKRDSPLQQNTIAKQDRQENKEDDMELSDDESNIQILGHDDSDIDLQAARQHSKASTQRLHERINALGKPPATRLSKSIPSAAAVVATIATAHQPKESSAMATVSASNTEEDDDDDWIQPLEENRSLTNQALYQDNDDSEPEGDFDVRAPELIAHEERMRQLSPSPQRPGYGHAKAASTITLASPAKSTMKPPPSPAKSISVSNPATSTMTPQGSPSRFMDGVSASKSRLQSIMKTAKGLFTSSASVSAAAKMETLANRAVETAMPGMYPILDKPLPASPPKLSRRTRSSAEREKEDKRKQKETQAMQKMEDQLEKVREQEKMRAAQQKAASPQKEEDPRFNTKLSRPVRPTREVSKAKPQPVSIRVGTMSQRMPISVTSGNLETLPAEPKRPGLTKKASTASLQSLNSTMTLKTSVNSQPVKPRALLAAEKKKEQDEKETQRKLEQKRELERKRAAQQEEIRRREQEQRAESERKERERITLERAKRQAQQQAIERKRLEASRKVEQQKNEREVARAPSRMGQQTNRPLVNHPLPTNPAKPAKRPVEEDNAVRPQAPKFGTASQHTDSKRRRTEEEQVEQPARPTMSGAPIRQSQLGKKPSIFNHPAYQQAPQSSHINQFPQPPTRTAPQMAQYATAKIPFAESSGAGPAKTPLSAYQHRTIQTVKSSPHYQNGESIHLPEIPTDSEDEDSEEEGNAFPIPDWATPGHLTEQLMRQESIDGDAVFGPIAPLKMEEIFAKGNKDRLKRLRDRTSSANWALSGDGLTLEEVKADREQRERMRLEGGWRYGT